jgi:hypothetical protein
MAGGGFESSMGCSAQPEKAQPGWKVGSTGARNDPEKISTMAGLSSSQVIPKGPMC